MSDLVQGEAVILLGPDPGSLTDYTCFISEFRIDDERVVSVKAPSFGSPYFDDMLGAGRSSVSMTFLAVPNTASGLWWELDRASRTRTGELYFEWRGDSAAVSASNPKRTGFLKVIGLGSGAPIGVARRQSRVFPARAVSAALAS